MDPQTWTIIGVNAAVVFAVVRIETVVTIREIRSLLGGVIARMDARAALKDRGELDRRLSALEDDMRLVKARLIGAA